MDAAVRKRLARTLAELTAADRTAAVEAALRHVETKAWRAFARLTNQQAELYRDPEVRIVLRTYAAALSTAAKLLEDGNG